MGASRSRHGRRARAPPRSPRSASTRASTTCCTSRPCRSRPPRSSERRRPFRSGDPDVTMMTLARKASKATLTPLGWPARRRRGDVVVLLYHRVGPGVSEIELAPDVFERQLQDLVATERVLTLDDVLAGDPDGGVVVTFDDGYRDFHRRRCCRCCVKHRVPATLYLATGLVANGVGTPSPDALTWTQLREAVDTGLVTIGSHTHGHADLRRRTRREPETEMRRSKELIEDHLGTACEHFAYPWAVGVGRRRPRGAAPVPHARRSMRGGRTAPGGSTRTGSAACRSCGATAGSSSAARFVGSSIRRPGSTGRSGADRGGGRERRPRVAHVATVDLTPRGSCCSRSCARCGTPGFDVTTISAPGPWVADSRPRASGTSRGPTRRGRGTRAPTPSRSASCSRSSGASASTWCTRTTRSPASWGASRHAWPASRT